MDVWIVQQTSMPMTPTHGDDFNRNTKLPKNRKEQATSVPRGEIKAKSGHRIEKPCEYTCQTQTPQHLTQSLGREFPGVLNPESRIYAVPHTNAATRVQSSIVQTHHLEVLGLITSGRGSLMTIHNNNLVFIYPLLFSTSIPLFLRIHLPRPVQYPLLYVTHQISLSDHLTQLKLHCISSAGKLCVVCWAGTQSTQLLLK